MTLTQQKKNVEEETSIFYRLWNDELEKRVHARNWKLDSGMGGVFFINKHDEEMCETATGLKIIEKMLSYIPVNMEQNANNCHPLWFYIDDKRFNVERNKC